MFENVSRTLSKWIQREDPRPKREKIALLDGQIVLKAKLLTEAGNAPVKKGKLQEIIITDPSGQKAAVKIKHLAKALHFGEKKVRGLLEEGQLKTHLSIIEKSLKRKESAQKELGLSSAQLIKISSKASLVLKENESMHIRLGLTKVLVTRADGEVLISKKVKVMGSGMSSKVSLFKGVLGNTAVKMVFDKEKAEFVKNEYEVLNHIHGDEKQTIGIQDKPYTVITVLSKTKKGKVKKQGYMGTLYSGDGMKIKQKISGPQTLSVINQLFSGLSVIQSKNVVHGDIKPENMLIRIKENSEDKFEVHLSDFGGARILDDRVSDESFFQKIYSPDFSCETDFSVRKELLTGLREGRLSQKDYRDQIKNLCFKMDVYSTSLSICELITGKQKPNVAELINNGVPESVADLIMRGFSENYKERPDPQEFLQAINSFLPH